MFPVAAKDPLTRHLARVRRLHQADLQQGYGCVLLPDALASKYPNAEREWSWQWVFPASKISADPRFGRRLRRHLWAAHSPALLRDAPT